MASSSITKFVISVEVLVAFVPLTMLWFYGVVFVIPMLIADPNDDYVTTLIVIGLAISALFGLYSLGKLYLSVMFTSTELVNKNFIRFCVFVGIVSLLGFNIFTGFNAWLIYFLPQFLVATHLLFLTRKHVF